MNKNSNMQTSKRNKNDEFYTQLEDIEKELAYYNHHFKGKTVYLNCDDTEGSNFFNYFYENFGRLRLKKLIATKYSKDKPSYKVEVINQRITKTELQGNGDFRTYECLLLLKESDIVVTNPPFSLFREYMSYIFKYQKQFLIVGSMNAITYKEIFPLIKANKMWPGVNGIKSFLTPDGEIKKFGNVNWFTNLQHAKRNEPLKLTLSYDPLIHVMYDNYNIINVNRVKDIPADYKGVMGVPISFVLKYNPDQFEIVGSRRWAKDQVVLDLYVGDKLSAKDDFTTPINGRETYDRIFIRHRKNTLVRKIRNWFVKRTVLHGEK